jgi:hypothetical protein
MQPPKPSPPPAARADVDPAAERQARLGAALRANLKRRKAQNRQRAPASDNNPENTKGS